MAKKNDKDGIVESVSRDAKAAYTGAGVEALLVEGNEKKACTELQHSLTAETVEDFADGNIGGGIADLAEKGALKIAETVGLGKVAAGIVGAEQTMDVVKEGNITEAVAGGAAAKMGASDLIIGAAGPGVDFVKDKFLGGSSNESSGLGLGGAAAVAGVAALALANKDKIMGAVDGLTEKFLPQTAKNGNFASLGTLGAETVAQKSDEAPALDSRNAKKTDLKNMAGRVARSDLSFTA